MRGKTKILARILIGAGIACAGGRIPESRAAEGDPTTQSTTAPASADDPVTPTTITLHVENTDAKQVLGMFSSQANEEIKTWPPIGWANNLGQHAISMNLDHVPFYDALLQWCQLTNCAPAFMSGPEPQTVWLNSEATGSNDTIGGAVCQSGLFMVVA